MNRFLTAAVLAVICAASMAEEPRFNVRDMPLERVNITAHRGAGNLAPENTISALELSWSNGWVPETDIRTTKDGVLVMFHDGNFKRILPNARDELKNKGIADLTWEEVQQLDIGSFRGEQFKGQKVVSLADIVEALKVDRSRMIYIDIKNVDIAQLARETAEVESQIIFTTWDYDLIHQWKKLAPKSEGFIWMGLGKGEDVVGPVIERLKAEHFADIDRMQIHVNFDDQGNTTPGEEFLRETADFIHTNYPNVEVQFMPWNVCDNKDCYKKLLDLGAAGFGSDRPDIAKEALCEYYDAGAVLDWNPTDYIPLNRVIVQAHRGYGNFGPEGSAESFLRAWNEGLIPEADIRLTKDGQIVSFHDSDLSRILVDAPEELKHKSISDLTLEEVKALDIGAYKGEEYKGQRALSMAEIVEILKEHPTWMVYCDIKNVDFEQLARETEPIHRQMIVCSTVYEQLLAWKKAAPKSLTLHWLGGPQESQAKRIADLEKVHFHGIDQLQLHTSVDADGHFTTTPEFYQEVGQKLRRHGVLMQSLIWGPAGSKAENYAALMDHGVASFATDYPTDTMKAISDYYQSRSEKK
ncbi:MAG: hypothetical protein IJH68_01200 [Thermoguttaceae bacterium]|nr:hypothetical protein [Thermoguttaceae bacterium]